MGKKLKSRKNVADILSKQGYSIAGDDVELKDRGLFKNGLYDYTEFIKRQQDFDIRKDANGGFKKSNNMYYNYMMIQCLQPIMHGAGLENIMRSVGMYAGICMFNRDFRGQFKSLIRDKVYPYMDAYANKNPDGRIAKLRDKIEETGEIPLTYESASAMQIGMLKKAYHDMRERGVDVGKIMDDYELASRMLRQKAEADGLSMDLLDREIRINVGRIIERRPEDIIYFKELASGEFQKAPRVSELVSDGNGSSIRMDVWHGDFVSSDGEFFDGHFTPRKPVMGSSYTKNVANNIMYDVTDNEDITMTEAFEIFDEYFKEYVVPEYDWGSDIIDYPTEAKAHLQREMGIDDYGADVAESYYREGLKDAMKEMEQIFPGFTKGYYTHISDKYNEYYKDDQNYGYDDVRKEPSGVYEDMNKDGDYEYE